MGSTASSQPGGCRTRLPIVLLHGIGFRDDMPLLNSWGRIPDCLRAAGATVFLGGLDAWSSHENNARLLKTQVERILGETGAEKVNLVAHSKGGLEARCMISRFGMAHAVASLTTVCTPHRGSSMADLVAGLLPDSRHLTYKAIDFFARCGGDRSADASAALSELTRPYLERFNRETPDMPGVYYQSYGALMRSPLDDPLFAFSYCVLRDHEGASDGMVSSASCQWGRFQGFITGQDPFHGISHADMVDFRRRDISGVNIPMVYVCIVEGLKALGF